VTVGATGERRLVRQPPVVFRADEELAEVTGVVRVGEFDRRCGADVADERAECPSVPGISEGLYRRIGCCSECSGSAIASAARFASSSAASASSVMPTERSSSNATV
jgi:hypothetical protein